MATTKPQFNVRLDPMVSKEIEGYCANSGIPQGKLVEAMWSRYRLDSSEAITHTTNDLIRLIASGVPQRDTASLYKLHVALQRAFADRLKETT